MNIKIRVIFCLFLLNVVVMQAKVDSSLIGRFEVDFEDLAKKSTTFINNSKYDLLIRWRLSEPGSLRQYTQEPLLRRAESVTINFDAALKYMQDAKTLELSLELLRVKKIPKGAEHPLVTSKLKDGSLALAIHKSKYLKYDIFAFSLNKNGLLVCKPSNRSTLFSAYS